MTNLSVSKGIVRGKTIELEHALDFPEGQAVTVVVQPAVATESQSAQMPGEGILRSAGTWMDAGVELDKWLEDVHSSRSQDRPATSR